MTDALSIPALTRNGYRRTERAEGDIRRTWDLRGRDLAAAFEVEDEADPAHLCAEALVFFIRRELAAKDQRSAEALFSLLVARSEKALRSMIRGVDEDARYDIQADVLADLTRLILAEDDTGDFLQSRFWLYLRRRATTARAKWLRSRWSFDDQGREADAHAQASVWSGEISPEDRAVIVDALNRLPPELRELVVLRHYEGWRVGDESAEHGQAAEPTLAERYGITPRGVRKRMAKAEALLTRDQRDDL
jgi:DNA-directed RNA polymerase specialized sigma24 family protein